MKGCKYSAVADFMPFQSPKLPLSFEKLLRPRLRQGLDRPEGDVERVARSLVKEIGPIFPLGAREGRTGNAPGGLLASLVDHSCHGPQLDLSPGISCPAALAMAPRFFLRKLRQPTWSVVLSRAPTSSTAWILLAQLCCPCPLFPNHGESCPSTPSSLLGPTQRVCPQSLGKKKEKDGLHVCIPPNILKSMLVQGRPGESSACCGVDLSAECLLSSGHRP